ncbi:unnamed protein product [Bursaphelenchus okinawaensis]|uniref:Uncharacterized protein n=1 Tax=Bursaphelenchus okinawaensis TaxID=465554 RepID=A0A811LI03_9BILA|nr:unnamed protein product [Bursaphelenchus okinawaensis]CAG9124165.1 unnamed protein product [Bursaphelenchus okinawaensis]
MSKDTLKYETDTLTETTNFSEDSTTSESTTYKERPEFRINFEKRNSERTMKRFFYCGGNVGIKRIVLATLILNALWSWAVGVASVYFDIIYNQAEFHRQFIHVYVCIVQTIIHYYTITGVVKSIVWNMQVFIMYTLICMTLLTIHCIYEFFTMEMTELCSSDQVIFTVPFILTSVGNVFAAYFAYEMYRFLVTVARDHPNFSAEPEKVIEEERRSFREYMFAHPDVYNNKTSGEKTRKILAEMA